MVVYQKARLDISLNIGDVKTTVEVAGSAALIETTTANVGTTIGEMPIVKLPLNLRRYGALATLVPGTTPDNGGTANSNKASPFSETSYNANGARSSSNNYLIDGVDSRNMGQGGFALQPPPDAIQEFKIQTNVYSAIFGITPGSTINLVTKAGTNQLHGSVYEFVRNDIFDAKNYFADSVGKNNRNQFGFALGGPLRKDKTFWFVNYEGLREAKALGGISILVPTALQRSGDFSSYLTGTPSIFVAMGDRQTSTSTAASFLIQARQQFTCPSGSTILVGDPIPGNIITNIDLLCPESPGCLSEPELLPGPNNYINDYSAISQRSISGWRAWITSLTTGTG